MKWSDPVLLQDQLWHFGAQIGGTKGSLAFFLMSDKAIEAFREQGEHLVHERRRGARCRELLQTNTGNRDTDRCGRLVRHQGNFRRRGRGCQQDFA